MSTRKQLKSLVEARRGLLVPGAFNALSARVIEAACAVDRPVGYRVLPTSATLVHTNPTGSTHVPT